MANQQSAHFSFVPLFDSLNLFERATMPALLKKSVNLTNYLREQLEALKIKQLKIITPAEPGSFGCQLSLEIANDAKELADKLNQAQVVCDFREPNIIRLAPTPFYNTYTEVWRVTEIFARFFSAT